MVRYRFLVYVTSHLSIASLQPYPFSLLLLLCPVIKYFECIETLNIDRIFINIFHLHETFAFNINCTIIDSVTKRIILSSFRVYLVIWNQRCLLPFIEKATEIVADSRAMGSVVVCNVLCKIFDSRHGELAEQVLHFASSFEMIIVLMLFLFDLD